MEEVPEMASDIDFYRFSKILSNLEVNKLLICSPEIRKEIQFVAIRVLHMSE
jgi:hypothetical protein